MKTTPLLLATVMLATGLSLAAQQPGESTGPAEPRAGEPNRRPGPLNSPGPREKRGDQPPGGAGARPMPNAMPRPDPLMENFFPPELIMHHQQALNLGDDQRKRLIETIQKAQPQFTELQWQLEAEQNSLAALLRAERSDEQQVLAQLDKVLRLESEMKRGQLMMLVRLKNALTPEQQAKLRETIRRPWGAGAGPNGAPSPQRGPGAPR